MKKPSKSLKVLVFACFIGLLTAYVLYASGIISLSSSKQGASASLSSHMLSKGIDSPPFKLPLWVALQDFPLDSSPVLAYKQLPGHSDTVAVLLGRSALNVVNSNLEHLSSSKAMVMPEPREDEGVDSVIVPRSWLGGSANTYLPQYVKDESFWMMSSKSGAPSKRTHPDRVRQNALLNTCANIKWQRIAALDQETPVNNTNNSPNRK